jgi:hypothetical protein
MKARGKQIERTPNAFLYWVAVRVQNWAYRIERWADRLRERSRRSTQW